MGVIVQRRWFRLWWVVGLIIGGATGCGSSVSFYSRPEAPWGTIQRVAVLPFTIPSESPARRQLITQLFTEELRRAGFTDLVELPLTDPRGGGPPNFEEIAKTFSVDAVFTGSVDDSQGTVIHLQLNDAATKDLLWSGTYLLGVGPEFFSLRTQQQQFQRSLKRMAREFATHRAVRRP